MSCFRRRRCEERSDEAIHSFFAWRDGLLRCARNDVSPTIRAHLPSSPGLPPPLKLRRAKTEASAKPWRSRDRAIQYATLCLLHHLANKVIVWSDKDGRENSFIDG